MLLNASKYNNSLTLNTYTLYCYNQNAINYIYLIYCAILKWKKKVVYLKTVKPVLCYSFDYY